MGRSSHLPRRAGSTGPPGDDTGCPILHVDMDAFFASIVVRSHPELRGRPVVVGGVGNRGVVSSATYEAREFGVRSAMPVSQARRLCPHAVVLPVDGAACGEASRAVMEILRTVTPIVEPLSLDEAFLDVAGAIRRMGRPTRIGKWIRERVENELHLTCSVGVAPTKFLAKLASTQCKPDGLLVVPADQVLDFLHPLPVSALWGVGERAGEQLRRMGLRTVGDVARTPLAMLHRSVGHALGDHLHALALGHDPRSVTPHQPDRSIGGEETFGVDVEDRATIHAELLRLAHRTARRLRRAGMVARTVSIKVRFADFRTITRSRTMLATTDSGQDLYATARSLFDDLGLDRIRIRLVGVRAEGLTALAAAPEQPRLDDPEHGWRDADRATDQAVHRFGPGAVTPGSLIGRAPRAVRAAQPARSPRSRRVDHSDEPFAPSGDDP